MVSRKSARPSHTAGKRKPGRASFSKKGASSKPAPRAPARAPSHTGVHTPVSVKKPAHSHPARPSGPALSASQPLLTLRHSSSDLVEHAHLFKLRLPTASIPASHLVSTLPADPRHPALNDAQTLEMLALGRTCYALYGQTRLFWSGLRPPIAEHEWLRFHFFQASLLSMAFWLLYALLALPVLSGALGFALLPFGLAEGVFVLLILIHFLLFGRLGHRAGEGEVPMVPLFGPQAALLASGDKPLDHWKM